MNGGVATSRLITRKHSPAAVSSVLSNRAGDDLCHLVMPLSICLGSFKYSIKNFLINLVSGLTFCLLVSSEWINRGSTFSCLGSRLSKSPGSSQAYKCQNCEHHSQVWCYLRDSRLVWFIETSLRRYAEWIFPIYFKGMLAVRRWEEGGFVVCVFFTRLHYFSLLDAERWLRVCTYRHVPKS